MTSASYFANMSRKTIFEQFTSTCILLPPSALNDAQAFSSRSHTVNSVWIRSINKLRSTTREGRNKTHSH